MLLPSSYTSGVELFEQKAIARPSSLAGMSSVQAECRCVFEQMPGTDNLLSALPDCQFHGFCAGPLEFTPQPRQLGKPGQGMFQFDGDENGRPLMPAFQDLTPQQ